MKDVFFKNFSIVTMGLTVGKDVMNFHWNLYKNCFWGCAFTTGLKFVNHELSNTKKKRKKLKVAHLTLTPLKYILYTKVHKNWTVRYKTGVKSNVGGNHTQVKLLRCCYTE
jgi:hypothetical protein